VLGILLPAVWFCRSDDRSRNTGNTQRESQSNSNGFFERKFQEVVFKLLYTLPVSVVIAVFGTTVITPNGIRDRAFRDDA
jgi:hypothetical protein